VRNNSTWAPSALSPIVWRPDAWNGSLTVLAILGSALLNFVPGLLYFVGAAALHAIDARHPASIPLEHLLFAQLLTFVPLGAFLLFALPRISLCSLHELGIRRPTLQQFWFGLAGTVAMFLAVNVASAIVGNLTHRQDTEAAVALLVHAKALIEKILFFMTACVLAPMIEELEFRVFLFNALTRYVSIPAAAVTSGIIFGIVHATSAAQLLTVSIPLACGGIVLAYVYARTRNYWSSVVTHAAFNSISVVAVFVFHAK